MPLWTALKVVLFYTFRCQICLPACPALGQCLNVGSGRSAVTEILLFTSSMPCCGLAH